MCPDQYLVWQAVSGEVSINTFTKFWPGTILGFNDYGWKSGTSIESLRILPKHFLMIWKQKVYSRNIHFPKRPWEACTEPQGKACHCNLKIPAVHQEIRWWPFGWGRHLTMLSVKAFFSVASLTSLLPCVPVRLSSVSDPCPYPSCLCLPLRTSFFPLTSSVIFPRWSPGLGFLGAAFLESKMIFIGCQLWLLPVEEF